MSSKVWKLESSWTDDLVDDRKMELHACRRQSQDLSQLEVLEHERFCSWRHCLSLQVWEWVGLGTELVGSFMKEIYKESPTP